MQQCQPDSAGNVTERPTEVFNAVLGAMDDEPVEVLITPPERGLQDRVQLGDAGGGGHEEAPPDQWADAGQHDAQLVEAGARGSGGCGGHRGILPAPDKGPLSRVSINSDVP